LIGDRKINAKFLIDNNNSNILKNRKIIVFWKPFIRYLYSKMFTYRFTNKSEIKIFQYFRYVNIRNTLIVGFKKTSPPFLTIYLIRF